MWLSLTVSFFSDLKVDWPEIEAVLSQRAGPLVQALLSDTLSNCLLPFLAVAILGTGALAVILLKDPPRRHLSRLQAVSIAGLVTAVGVFFAADRIVRFWMGTGRFFAFEFMQQAQPFNPQGQFVIDPDKCGPGPGICPLARAVAAVVLPRAPGPVRPRAIRRPALDRAPGGDLWPGTAADLPAAGGPGGPHCPRAAPASRPACCPRSTASLARTSRP